MSPLDRHTLSERLRALPAPEPGHDLLPRILRSRSRGVRSDYSEPHASAWRWVAAAAVTLLLIGSWKLAVMLPRMRDSVTSVSDPIVELLRGALGRHAESPGEPSRPSEPPKYPLVLAESLELSRLRSGTWTYRSQTTIDGVLTQPSFLSGVRVRLTREALEGRPAWLLNVAQRFRSDGWGDFTDTTFVDAETLRPLRVIAYGYKRRTRIVQTFGGDSGTQSIEITGPMQGSARGGMAMPFPSNAVFANDWKLHRLGVLLAAFPLVREWRGSVYQTGLFSRSAPGVLEQHAAPLNLRVTGSTRVSVPAGSFDCWRIEADTYIGEAVHWTLWVAREPVVGLVRIERRDGDYVTNEELEAYEPEPEY